jgi:hypothetical protein
MAHMSDYLENKLIDHLFRGTAYTAPAGVYIALFTANPTDTGGGTEVSTSGTAYARVNVAPGTGNWANTQNSGVGVSSGTSGTTQNINTITFGTPTANWGVVTGIGLFDASTAGNLLFWAPLAASKTVNNGDPAPSFPAGTLTVQLDN